MPTIGSRSAFKYPLDPSVGTGRAPGYIKGGGTAHLFLLRSRKMPRFRLFLDRELLSSRVNLVSLWHVFGELNGFCSLFVSAYITLPHFGDIMHGEIPAYCSLRRNNQEG